MAITYFGFTECCWDPSIKLRYLIRQSNSTIQMLKGHLYLMHFSILLAKVTHCRENNIISSHHSHCEEIMSTKKQNSYYIVCHHRRTLQQTQTQLGQNNLIDTGGLILYIYLYTHTYIYGTSNESPLLTKQRDSREHNGDYHIRSFSYIALKIPFGHVAIPHLLFILLYHVQ